MERASAGSRGGAAGDRERRRLRPAGNAQVQREAHRPLRPYREPQFLPEGVIGLQLDAHRYAAHLYLQRRGGVGRGHEAAVARTHPQMSRELGPPLAEVGGAAAEVGFQAKDVGIGSVGIPDPVLAHAALDLIHLLVVLMRPHVRGEGRRQRVEGDALQPVRRRRVAQHADQTLQRIEVLDHGAQLGPLAWIGAGQAFVAAEHPGRRAVVPVERLQHALRRAAVAAGAGQPRPQRPFLERHGVVHHVGVVAPAPLGGGAGARPLLEVELPVEPLRAQAQREVDQPALPAAVVEPPDRHQELEPPILAPVRQRVAVEVAVQHGERSLDGSGNPVVRGGVVVSHQHLEGERLRPEVGRP